ncbi:hypothetical protein E2C01_035613 [Portunus trituberculatus]|uniref:Uncharacterized protein n=1 Tax=Portunus trituberculatus TaxID=210409 RepID=A0A5B7F4N1_PORTR|nr:hypothetical protein [Portunus trituberculatus]
MRVEVMRSLCGRACMCASAGRVAPHSSEERCVGGGEDGERRSSVLRDGESFICGHDHFLPSVASRGLPGGGPTPLERIAATLLTT